MTHLRQLMLEELRRRNYAESTIHAYLRTVEHFAGYFHLPSRPTGAGAHPPVSSRHVHPVEAGPEHRDARACGAALLLHPGLEARLECCRDAVSEEGSAPAACAQPGRDRTSDRCGRDAFFTSFTSRPSLTFLLHLLRQRSTSQPYAQRDAPPVGPACFRRGWF